jgi:hypothetical protein
VELSEEREFFEQMVKISQFKNKSGSHPVGSNRVVIVCGDDKIVLDLKLDSREKELYWVFYPKYKFKSEIGYVRFEKEIKEIKNQ